MSHIISQLLPLFFSSFALPPPLPSPQTDRHTHYPADPSLYCQSLVMSRGKIKKKCREENMNLYLYIHLIYYLIECDKTSHPPLHHCDTHTSNAKRSHFFNLVNPLRTLKSRPPPQENKQTNKQTNKKTRKTTKNNNNKKPQQKKTKKQKKKTKRKKEKKETPFARSCVLYYRTFHPRSTPNPARP